jgi:hypothetical protein
VSKQCPRCSETVDAAKAFCPGCGHAFETEQAAEHNSGFDKMDSTVQLGQTMYNQMLSDMQLNISKAPASKITELSPVAAPKPRPTPPAPVRVPEQSTKTIWLITAGFVAFTIAIIVLIAVALLLYRFW